MKFRIDKSKAYMTLAKGDNINKTFESFLGLNYYTGIGIGFGKPLRRE